MAGHFYNVVVVNPQFADAENKKKDPTLPLTCFLVPDSQGIEGQLGVGGIKLWERLCIYDQMSKQ